MSSGYEAKFTGAGVYSNSEILDAVEAGHIVCVPFNPENVTWASMDVTLGENYFRIEQSDERIIYNPFDKDDVERYFDGPYQAMPHAVWANALGVKLLKNIPPEHPVIPLKPGERILAHTHEFYGIKPPGAQQLLSRSSWGRNGVAVCFDAGWVDPGYINRLTLEIYNLNQREAVVLPIGERIAQAVFYHTGPVVGNYGKGQDTGSGKYQQGTDIDQLVGSWTPESMLPKAWIDKRQMPAAIPGLKLLIENV